jgi:hypothetical protein
MDDPTLVDASMSAVRGEGLVDFTVRGGSSRLGRIFEGPVDLCSNRRVFTAAGGGVALVVLESRGLDDADLLAAEVRDASASAAARPPGAPELVDLPGRLRLSC